MASRQPLNVIDLDGARLSVLSASVVGARIAVRSWLAASRPDEVAGDDAEAVGRWVGEELRRAGLHRHRALLAVSRGDVVLKSMDFPVAAGMSDAELAGAVRLQMSRQLTMPLEGTAIDYAKLSERAAEGGQLATVAVLAGAMPADRVNWCRAMARSAGLTLHRIGLRCCGVAALLGELSLRKDGPVLGIAPGWSSAEFVVVREGHMVFARAVDMARPAAEDEWPAYAERIAVEAKRTWMSYQGARGSAPVQVVAIVAEPELAAAVGARAGQALEVGWELISAPATVEFPSAAEAQDRAAMTSLVGMVLEESLDRPALDFANTRKAVDRSVVRRQRVLLGVLVAILVSGTGWVMAQQSLDALTRRVAAAKQSLGEKRDEFDRYQLEFLRVNHVERWRSVKVDWLAHLGVINEQLPDPRQATADEISGRVASAEVSFSPKKGEYSDDDWAAQQLLEFVVRGRVNHRDVAADLRGRLMNSKLYTVENKGPDVPDRFSLSLLTTQTTPVEKLEKVEPRPAAPVAAAKEGGR